MRGITFIGAGALAQGLAAHLAPHVPVTLVASQRTSRQLLQDGAITVTGLASTVVEVTSGPPEPGRVTVVDNPGTAHKDDALLFTTKGPQLADVVAQVPPEGRTSLVAGLQNGVVKDDVLTSHFGRDAVIGAVTLFNARRENGNVVVGGTGFAYFGEFSGEASKRVDDLVATFDRSNLKVAASNDIRSLTWMKFVNALGVFGVSALTRRTSSVVMQTPELASAYLDLLAEAASVAVAEGVRVGDHRDIPMRSYLTRDKAMVCDEIVSNARASASGPGSLSSMAADVLASRLTEASETFGDVVSRAEAHRIAVPRLTFVRDLLTGSDATLT